jgi:hypothetical protein
MNHDLHVPRIHAATMGTLIAQFAHGRIVANVINLVTFWYEVSKQPVTKPMHSMRLATGAQDPVPLRRDITVPEPAAIVHGFKVREKRAEYAPVPARMLRPSRMGERS